MTLNRRGESGNVFFTLFGAVALVGVIGVATSTLMRGPVGTVVTLNQKAKVESQLQIARKLVALDAAQRSDADCDNDGIIEPTHADISTAECASLIPGGGCLPQSVGASKTDPWGTLVGYCAWDHALSGGGSHNGAGCPPAVGERALLAGIDGDSSRPVLAVISAGPNRTFETSCAAHPAYVTKAAGSDDIIFEWTYDEASTGLGGGLWSLMSGSDAITTARDIDIATDATFRGGTTAAFEGTADFRSGSTLDLTGGGLFKLPTSQGPNALTSCTPADAGILRVDTSGGGQVLQICDPSAFPDSWVDIGGSGAATSVAGGEGDIQFNSGSALFASNLLNWDNSNARLRVGTASASTRTLEVGGSAGVSGSLNVGQQILGSAGTAAEPGFSFTSAASTGLFLDSGTLVTSIGGNERFIVSNAGADVLGGLTTTGNASVGDVLYVSSNALIGGSVDVGGILFSSGTNPLRVGDDFNVTGMANFDGMTSFDSSIYVTNTANAGFFAVDGTIDGFGVITNGDTGMTTDGAGGIRFMAGGSARLQVESDGDVGIGLSGLPTTRLDVDGIIRLRDTGREVGDLCGAPEGSITYASGDMLLVCSQMTGRWESIGTSGGGGGGSGSLWQRLNGALQPQTGQGVDDFVIGITNPGVAGTYMFFDRSKGAFRVGQVGGAQWGDANVGDNSVAFGLNTSAAGAGSFAAGTSAVVTGTGNNSFAFGLGAAGGAAPQVSGSNSFGIFMGDQTGVNLGVDNVMLLAGGSLVIDPDQTSATNITPSNGLALDVHGSVGAINFCNENGTQCFTAADIAGGAFGAPGSDRQMLFNSNGSLWADPGIFYSVDNRLGVGVATAMTRLDVLGSIRMAYDGEACDADREGTIHYDSGSNQFMLCRNAAQGWQAIAAGAPAAAAPVRGVQFNSGGMLWADSGFTFDADGDLTVSTTAKPAWLNGDGVRSVISDGFLSFGGFYAANGGAFAFGDATTQIRGDASSDILDFETNAGVAMRINAARNVRIGSNDTPGTRLDVGGTLRIAYEGEACDATRVGGVHYDSGSQLFRVCRVAGQPWEVLASGAAAAGGSDRQVMFNSGGLLDGAAGFIFSSTGELMLTVNATDPAGDVRSVRGMTLVAPTANQGVGVTNGGIFGLAVADGSFVKNTIVGGDFASAGGGTGNINWLIGSRSVAQNAENITIDTITGDVRNTIVSAGNVTDAYGGQVVSQLSGGTVENSYGMSVQLSGGATITNRYGLFLNSVGSATNDWGIYQFSAQPSRLGGALGVGTPLAVAPATQLDVAGTIRMSYGGEACDATRVGGIQYNSGTQQFLVCRVAGQPWEVVAAGTAAAAGGNRQIQFNSAGTFAADPNFVFHTNGGLGIGLSGPQHDLHIRRDATQAGLRIEGNGTFNDVIWSVSSRDTSDIWQWDLRGSSAGDYRNYNLNRMDGSTSNWITVLGFNLAGNMGVGTNAPQTKADVRGTLRVGYSNEACDANREGAIHFNSADNKFYVCKVGGQPWSELGADVAVTFVSLTDTPSDYTGAANRFVKVNTAANGLEFSNQIVATVTGQPAPTGLTLSGLDDVTTGSPVDGNILMYSAGLGQWVSAANDGGGSGNGGFWTAGAGDNIYYNSGTTPRVGIGNANPTQALDVTGNVRVSNSLQLGGVAGAAPNYMMLNDLSNVNVASPSDGHILMYSAGLGQWVSAANDGGGSGNGGFWVAGANDNIYYTSGTTPRVGIGNAAPTQALDVTGVIRASQGVQLGTVAAATPLSMMLGDLGNVTASSPADGHILMYSAGAGQWISAANAGGGGGGGTPGGANRQFQFNDSGAFGGSTNFVYNADGTISFTRTDTGTAAEEVMQANFVTSVAPTANQSSYRQIYGLRSATIVPAGNNFVKHGVYAIEGYANNNSSGGSVDDMNGVIGMSSNSNGATTNWSVGVWGEATAWSGNVTRNAGAYLLSTVGGGNVTNDYALWIANYHTGGTITNRFGIFMAAPTGTATNDWGIYQAGAQNNYLRGNLGINNTNPNVALDVIGDIEYTGTITDVSDMRLKTDIVPLIDRGSMLARIAQVDTYSFRMKDDEKGRIEFGVMAQELEALFPELVHTAPDEMGTKSVNYIGLIAPMIAATKELQADNDNLRAEVAALRAERDEITVALNDLAADVRGLKAHTGYGIGRAEMGLWMLLIILAAGSSALLVGGIVRNRQRRAE